MFIVGDSTECVFIKILVHGIKDWYTIAELGVWPVKKLMRFSARVFRIQEDCR